MMNSLLYNILCAVGRLEAISRTPNKIYINVENIKTLLKDSKFNDISWAIRHAPNYYISGLEVNYFNEDYIIIEDNSPAKYQIKIPGFEITDEFQRAVNEAADQ